MVDPIPLGVSDDFPLPDPNEIAPEDLVLATEGHLHEGILALVEPDAEIAADELHHRDVVVEPADAGHEDADEELADDGRVLDLLVVDGEQVLRGVVGLGLAARGRVGVLVHLVGGVPVPLLLLARLRALLVHHLVDLLHVVGEALQEHAGELRVVLQHALADVLAHRQQVRNQHHRQLGFGGKVAELVDCFLGISALALARSLSAALDQQLVLAVQGRARILRADAVVRMCEPLG